MPAIAIVGAGPGLGLALAAEFGRHGWSAALIGRRATTLDPLVTKLEAQGVEAAAFIADTADQPALVNALTTAEKRLGPLDALEFSPYSAGPGSTDGPLDVTPESMRPVIESHLMGAVTAVSTVLPGMRERGRGTILLTAGIGAIDPLPVFGTLNTVQAATRSWARNLRGALEGSGVHVAHVAIGVGIGESAPAPGYPFLTSAQIAAQLWDLHESPDTAELVIAP